MNETSHTATTVGQDGRRLRRPRLFTRTGLAIGGAVLGAALLAGCGSSSSTTDSNAVSATPTALKTLAQTLKQPIYWVGPRAHVTYERTTLASGRILVRYLPQGPRSERVRHS